MRYRRIYLDKENYYSVGIDEDTGDYLLEVVITWIACYSIFFRLNQREIEAFQADPTSLTDLSYEMAADKGQRKFRDQLVLNEGPASR